jgi:hypothetical protein
MRKQGWRVTQASALIPRNFFCHSGAARRAEPGIQNQGTSERLDSGFARPARPGMTTE